MTFDLVHLSYVLKVQTFLKFHVCEVFCSLLKFDCDKKREPVISNSLVLQRHGL
jgi:hypothetical protein